MCVTARGDTIEIQKQSRAGGGRHGERGERDILEIRINGRDAQRQNSVTPLSFFFERYSHICQLLGHVVIQSAICMCGL